MNGILQLKPMVNLHPYLADGEIVAFNVGPDGYVYLVIALKPLDYAIEQPGWATFAKTVPDQPQKYRVVALSGDQPVLNVVIGEEQFNIHHVQPLGDELLLVCARSYYKGPNDFEKNGRVYTRDGKFVRSMLLGDGIQSVQTTSDGVIWTSFFDEGVFGNFGWQEPIGASGLVAWDSQGNKLYEFQPPEGLDSICDCYALNVESDDDVWCYYYTEFPLVHLHRNRIESFWKMPVGGSDAFAISAGRALFRGGYKESDSYYFFSLETNGQVRQTAKIQLQDSRGDNLVAERAVGRANAIHLISSGYLYRIDLRSIVPEDEG